MAIQVVLGEREVKNYLSKSSWLPPTKAALRCRGGGLRFGLGSIDSSGPAVVVTGLHLRSQRESGYFVFASNLGGKFVIFLDK